MIKSEIEEVLDNNLSKINLQKDDILIFSIDIEKIKPDLAGKFANLIRERISENLVVIPKGTELSNNNKNAVILDINNKSYSYNDLMNIIEKATMYESLCK